MFVKGHKGGRPKGMKNKPKKYDIDISEMLTKFGCDPFEAMVRVGMKCEQLGDLKTALQAYKELAMYVAPKKRSVEVTVQKEEIPNIIGYRPLTNAEWSKKYGKGISNEDKGSIIDGIVDDEN